ncbi:hypothetical protein MPSEU_000933900 [Mayamaea pseudoterrestris]|nr:hypothetical protein MPSEU_000933900 [Mayamaea pseudoterrestris]
MASSMWSALEGQMTAAMGHPISTSSSAIASSTPASAPASFIDPNRYLHQQLASALSTFGGDAQYWDESISPASIRETLSKADPNNIDSASDLLRPMKWLLACISKGRNVSDYFMLVVKLVGCKSLEVRILVYTYLVQYADYDASTRELSLLSINAFQKGLADRSDRIRAMALRVLTSVRLSDILQIQILAVQKCTRDESPYVRKCAATAVGKLAERCARDNEQLTLLTELVHQLLASDTCCMVLTSAVAALEEVWKHSATGGGDDKLTLQKEQLSGLHSSYRKLCHLLTDMDEWGQVIVLDVLQRYARCFFCKPPNVGTAERLDRQRRVRRLVHGLEQPVYTKNGAVGDDDNKNGGSSIATAASSTSTDVFGDVTMNKNSAVSAATSALPPHPNANGPRKVKRKVVKKGFYSDEEDSSTEEEVYEDPVSGQALPMSTAFREPVALNTHISVFRDNATTGDNGNNNNQQQSASALLSDSEDSQLDSDHRLLLHSAMPLLKSRNAGVVLAVCSLLYYCGVASVYVRASMGRALVRIHRDKREIQHVVLASIRMLARECPSAFGPFLPDFFVKAMDPPFTRIVKLDILTSLALDPKTIQVVLEELRIHVHDADVEFACAAIRAVGRVVETARIVHDRRGQQTQQMVPERAAANLVALNALFGLVTCTRTSRIKAVVGECVVTMQLILQLLWSDAGDHGELLHINDPNHIQALACKRILLLLVSTLSQRVNIDKVDAAINNEINIDEDGGAGCELSKLENITSSLPSQAVASALWIIGEALTTVFDNISFVVETHRSQICSELARLIVRAFLELKSEEKEQGIHLACKLLVYKAMGTTTSRPDEGPLCEQILAMGRIDMQPDIRDRARFVSALVQTMIGFNHDSEGCIEPPTLQRSLRIADAESIFIKAKNAPSLLPLVEEKQEALRFGTLSSLVGHRARAYVNLPPWATENSSSDLREASKPNQSIAAIVNRSDRRKDSNGQFYDSSDSDSDSSSSSSSTNKHSSDDSGLNNEDEHTKEQPQSVHADLTQLQPQRRQVFQAAPEMQLDRAVMARPSLTAFEDRHGVEGSSESDLNSSSSSASSSSSDQFAAMDTAHTATGRESATMDFISSETPGLLQPDGDRNGSYIADDFKGMTLATPSNANTSTLTERETSDWTLLVRPEHASGVSVESRYLRGELKCREALVLGLNDGSSLICLQIRFKNKKSSGTCRSLRIQQKTNASSTTVIGPRRVVPPPEILELAAGATETVVVAIQFASISDREGALQAKLDFGSSTGAVPLVIKPRLGDLLLPCRNINAESFDAALSRLQGFQRVESKLSNQDVALAAERLMGSLALIALACNDQSHRFMGTLPASSDPVYILLSEEKLIVCCDHAMAANNIMNHAKQALRGI